MVNRQDFYPYIIREDGSKYIVQSYDNMCYSVEEYQESHLERFKTYQRDTGKDYNSFLTSEVRNYGRCFITKSARTMREMLDYPTHLKINDPELGEFEGKLIWPEQTKVEWQKIIDFLQSKHPEVRKADNTTHIHELEETPIQVIPETIGQKVMYLKELGLLDFLIEKHRLKIDGSINCDGLASFIQGFTGEHHGTLGDALRVIYKYPKSSKNPYNITKNRESVTRKVEQLNNRYPPL